METSPRPIHRYGGLSVARANGAGAAVGAVCISVAGLRLQEGHCGPAVFHCSSGRMIRPARANARDAGRMEHVSDIALGAWRRESRYPLLRNSGWRRDAAGLLFAATCPA